MPIVHVTATPLTPANNLHEDDQACPGRYTLSINDDVPAAHLGNAALDVFHSKIAIKQLDDFQFVVSDHQNLPLESSDEIEEYVYSDDGDIVDHDATMVSEAHNDC